VAIQGHESRTERTLKSILSQEKGRCAYEKWKRILDNELLEDFNKFHEMIKGFEPRNALEYLRNTEFKEIATRILSYAESIAKDCNLKLLNVLLILRIFERVPKRINIVKAKLLLRHLHSRKKKEEIVVHRENARKVSKTDSVLRRDKSFLYKLQKILEKTQEEKFRSLHENLKEMIKELGNLLDKVSNTEEPIPGGGYIDITWRKRVDAVPYIAFEIHISGNLHADLAKLKYAKERWNCIPVLITDENGKAKANKLINGPFSELKNSIRIITVDDICSFYEVVRRLKEMHKKLGEIFFEKIE